ncbi:hypothetical protein Cpir12675_006446 [Ceratocystis pirilliformis]|uniref:Uncharacterized protein n=1 Tax=Ceratocystis pirilliformis TaxID=259994 RepID=A0ABR3YHQ3_9PEZI
MFSNLALALALVAAVLVRAGDIVNSPLGIDSSGILRLSASEATVANYGEIVKMRKAAEVSLSSTKSSFDLNNDTDLNDVSNKGSTKASDRSISEVPLNPDGTVNMEIWESTTEQACQKALSSTAAASNPSGTGICYNLPALNMTSGVFQADLRLYKISDPSREFTAVLPSNIQVQLSYDGAFVSTVDVLNKTTNASTTITPGSTSNVPRSAELESLTKRDISVERRANEVPLLKQYMLVGQIDPSRMTPDMSLASLEALAMPILTLNAAGATGVIQTNVSSNEALFVNGIFSREVVMSDLSLAMWAVEAVHAELANGTVAFVLPGMQLMVYPIGLGITGGWMLIGFAVYGFGTYERFMYAARYRRQKAMAAPAVKTF